MLWILYQWTVLTYKKHSGSFIFHGHVRYKSSYHYTCYTTYWEKQLYPVSNNIVQAFITVITLVYNKAKSRLDFYTTRFYESSLS